MKNFSGFGSFRGVITDFNPSVDATISSTFTVSFIHPSLKIGYEFGCNIGTEVEESYGLANKDKIRLWDSSHLPPFLRSGVLEMTACELRACGVKVKFPSEAKNELCRSYQKSSRHAVTTSFSEKSRSRLKGPHGDLVLRCRTDVENAMVGIGVEIPTNVESDQSSTTKDRAADENDTTPPDEQGKNANDVSANSSGEKRRSARLSHSLELKSSRDYSFCPLLLPTGDFLSSLERDNQSILDISDATIQEYISKHETSDYPPFATKLFQLCRNGGKTCTYQQTHVLICAITAEASCVV